MKNIFLLLFISVMMFSFGAPLCEDPDADAEFETGDTSGNSNVFGTVYITTDVTDTPWIVVIDNDHEGGNGIVSSDEGTVTGNSFSYTLYGIPAGDYYIYAQVATGTGVLGPWEPGDYAGDMEGCPCYIDGESEYSNFDITLYLQTK